MVQLVQPVADDRQPLPDATLLAPPPVAAQQDEEPPGTDQDIPSLEEIYFTFIPTHKFAPKPARAEFSREIARLWDRLVADMNDEPSWSRSGLEGGELVSFVLSGRKQ